MSGVLVAVRWLHGNIIFSLALGETADLAISSGPTRPPFHEAAGRCFARTRLSVVPLVSLQSWLPNSEDIVNAVSHTNLVSLASSEPEGRIPTTTHSDPPIVGEQR
jgi:hypothetical protein